MASEMWMGLICGRGDPIGVGHARVEVLVRRDLVRSKGRLVWATKPKTEPWGLGFG